MKIKYPCALFILFILMLKAFSAFRVAKNFTVSFNSDRNKPLNWNGTALLINSNDKVLISSNYTKLKACPPEFLSNFYHWLKKVEIVTGVIFEIQTNLIEKGAVFFINKISNFFEGISGFKNKNFFIATATENLGKTHYLKTIAVEDTQQTLLINKSNYLSNGTCFIYRKRKLLLSFINYHYDLG